MNEQTIMELGRQAMIVLMLVAGPLLVVGMTVGLLVSVLQTITSIREQTLTFVPKMVAVVGATLILLPWLLSKLCQFTVALLGNLNHYTS